MQKAHVEIPTTRQLHQQYNRAMSRDSDHQDGPRTHEPTPNKQSLPLIFTVMALILCLLAFFIVYFCRYVTTFAWFHRNPAAGTTIQIHRSESSPKGLDPLIISSFPIFTYASVKDHRQEKCELECAVCLSEFSGDDVLRLLSVCNHAFHPECIDLWFQSHTTCPVCRGDLDLQFDKSIEKAPEVVVQVAESETEEEEEDSGARVSFREEQDRGSEHRVTVDWLARPVRPHSTGHSPAVDDRFTLRLPENIKEEIVRERKRTGSCITFRDVSNSVDTGKYELEGPENPEFRHPSDQI